MDEEQRRRTQELAQQRKRVQMAEILDQLHELADPLAGVLDPNDTDDAEVLDYYDRVIEALEDRTHG